MKYDANVFVLKGAGSFKNIPIKWITETIITIATAIIMETVITTGMVIIMAMEIMETGRGIREEIIRTPKSRTSFF